MCLLQATEDNHPDKAEILQAINAMTDVATAINEYKRRKDLGRPCLVVTLAFRGSLLERKHNVQISDQVPYHRQSSTTTKW